MSLITCPECGKSISEYADFCIGCGCRMEMIELLRGDFAKRNMALLLSSVLVEDALMSSLKNIRPSNEYMQVIRAVLATLTPREEKVLLLRFGLEDGHLHTYEEISAIWKVAPERICQIEETAIRKLRIPSRSNKLKVISEYPSIDALRCAAEKSGYLLWTETDTEPFIGNNGFSRCCFDLFGLYDPSAYECSVELTLTNFWQHDIEALCLSVRSYNCLKNANINTMSELVQLSVSELTAIRNLGRKSCDEILEKLAAIGITLTDEMH